MWQTILAVVGVLAAVGVLFVYLSQLWAMRRSHLLDSISRVASLLQSDDARKSRAVLLQTTWDLTNHQYRHAADDVGHVMQTLAFLVRTGALDEEPVIYNWGDTVARAWEAAEPFIEDRRAKDPKLWTDFQILATRAKKSAEQRRSTHFDGAPVTRVQRVVRLLKGV